MQTTQHLLIQICFYSFLELWCSPVLGFQSNNRSHSRPCKRGRILDRQRGHLEKLMKRIEEVMEIYILTQSKVFCQQLEQLCTQSTLILNVPIEIEIMYEEINMYLQFERNLQVARQFVRNLQFEMIKICKSLWL